jgi:hypothetical protein
MKPEMNCLIVLIGGAALSSVCIEEHYDPLRPDSEHFPSIRVHPVPEHYRIIDQAGYLPLEPEHHQW